MKKTLIMLTALTLSTIIVNNASNSSNIKESNKITQLYVLGDSLSDSNNLANIISSLTLGLDKINFQKPFFDNSFTNGDTAVKVVAKKLNLSINPAWATKTVGNNYAVAGARATKTTSWFEGLILNRATIQKQATKLLKEHTIKNSDEIFLEIGGNDLLASLDLKNAKKQEQLINTAVNNEISAVQNLINHGAKNLVVSDAPNVSYTPRFNHGDKKEIANKLSIDFNNLWKNKITQLINLNPKVNLLPFDLAKNMSDTIELAKKIGKNINQASIKYSKLDLFLNKKPQYINGITPETIDNDLFFDDIHPNKWGHEQLGEAIYKTIKT